MAPLSSSSLSIGWPEVSPSMDDVGEVLRTCSNVGNDRQGLVGFFDYWSSEGVAVRSDKQGRVRPSPSCCGWL